MSLTDTELKTLADLIVGGLVARRAYSPPATPLVPQRLTVPQFAVCVGRCPAVVRRKIRERFIAKEYVQGPPYYIDRAALGKFRVTLEAAFERLQQARFPADAAGAPTPALSPAPSGA